LIKFHGREFELARIICVVFVSATMGAAATSLGATPPSAADLAACAAITATDARLACYDALAARSSAPTAPAAAVSPGPAATPASTSTSTAEAFGLPPAQVYKDVRPKSIEAHIASIEPDGLGHARVVLDIGQTWTVVDASGALSIGDAVKIKRASLGSYLMTAGSKGAFRVHRTQ